MTTFAILSLISAFLNFGLGIYLLARDFGSLANRLFVALLGVLTFWGIAQFFWSSVANPVLALWIFKLSSLGIDFLAPLYFHFVWAFTHPQNKVKNPLFFLFLYGPFLIFSIVDISTDLISKGVIKGPWGFQVVSGSVYGLFAVFVIVFFLWGTFILVRTAFLVKKKKQKQQLILVSLATLVPLIIGTITDLILPSFGIFVMNLAVFASSIMAVMMLYFIFRYGVMTITIKSATTDIIAIMPGALFIVSPPVSKILRINPAACQLLGYKKSELYEQPISRLFEEEELTQDIFLERIIKKGAIRERETIMKSKYGEKIPVSLSGTVLRDKNGELLGVVYIAIDMRTYKKIYTELLEKEKQLNIEVKKLSDARTALFHMLKDITSSQKELEQKNKDLEEMSTQLKVSLAEVTKSKELTQSLMEAALTAKKEVENKKMEIEKYRDHLEEIVAARTRDLTIANEELKGVDQLKGQFIANMSHELRTPLNSILGFSEVLQDETFGPLNNKQKEYIKNVLFSGQHLLTLINDILDLAKVESGKIKLDFSSFPIKELLEDSLIMIKEKALIHNIEIVLKIPDEIGSIKADNRRLKQIIYNGLSNAVKFTPDGGKIKISAKKIGKEIEIRIKDTGIGIAKEDQEKVFEEFFQVDNAYTKEYQGTGLGLSLAKKLVEMHGGRIWVESEGLGKGTTFRFNLLENTDFE